VAQAIHDAGAKVFAQIFYSRVANPWRYEPGSPVAPLFGPSQMQIFDDFHVTHEMSVATIKKVIEAHRITSAHLAEAGYDGIQVHCSHAMLVEAFLSPHFNHRSDEWGGSLENRMRFLVECLMASREGGGPALSVGMRMNVDEMVSGGLDQSDTREILERLVEMKLLDYVDMDVALEPDQYPFGMPPYFIEPGLYEGFVRGVRSAAGEVPVLCVLGRVTTIAQAERAISEGVCDMVGAARGLMTEPELVKHALEGREDDSRICLACNLCLTNNHGHFGCAINPSTGREWFWNERSLKPSGRRSKVVVVGGGPAGMEAARVAAKNGHEVVLFERRSRLGGQMNLWAALPGRDVFATTGVWYEHQLRKLGVSVRTGVEASAAMVLSEGPDAVIVATGARYIGTGESGFMGEKIPGHDRNFVYTPEQIIEQGVRLKGRVFVLDDEGINTAAGVAEMLAMAGAQVRLVTRWLQPVQHMGPFEFVFVIPRLQTLGVELEQMRYLKEIGDGTVTTFNVFTNEEQTDPVDAVVLATGRRSTTTLGKELEGKVEQLFLAGDALSPRGLSEAFYEGHRFGRYAGDPSAPHDFTEDYFSPQDGSKDQRPARMLLQLNELVRA
jgi:2,4-dienoyl-CoA reductase-like NADH-dependent reductase (Old Yellow Enzyme family)/thioredoxin reductase